MGRKEREKKKKKRQAGKKPEVGPERTASQPGGPDLPGHLSGDWREFYRLVLARISQRNA